MYYVIEVTAWNYPFWVMYVDGELVLTDKVKEAQTFISEQAASIGLIEAVAVLESRNLPFTVTAVVVGISSPLHTMN